MKKRFLCALFSTAICISLTLPAVAEQLPAEKTVAAVSQNGIEAADEKEDQLSGPELSLEEILDAQKDSNIYPANGELPKQIPFGKDTNITFLVSPNTTYGARIKRKGGTEVIWSRNETSASAKAGSTMADAVIPINANDTAKFTIGDYVLEYWVGSEEANVMTHEFAICRSISAADNKDITRKLDDASVIYTGAAITPVFVITDKVNNTVKTLVQGTDYSVTVTSANKNAIGSAEATITGMGNYIGTEKVSFDIRPNAPAGITVTSLNTTANRITWKKVPEAAGYVIQRKGISGGFTTVGETDSNTFAYDDMSGLYVGDTYFYRVCAFAPNAADTALRTYSAEDTVGTKIVMTCAAPQIKQQTAVNTKSVKLSWDAVPGALGYNLYLKDAKGQLVLQKKNITKTNYTVTKLKCGTKYKYVLKAYAKSSDGGIYESLPSPVFKAKSKPATVQGVAVKALNATNVQVTWKKISDASGYIIYRRQKGDSKDDWKKIATVKGASKLSYTDGKAKTGVKYYYTVSAYKKVKKKKIKGSMNAKGKDVQTVCDGPALATEQRHATIANVYIQNVDGADGFYLYRKTGTGEYAQIATVTKTAGTNITTYRDEKVAAENTYTYVAKAYSIVDGKKVEGQVGKEVKLVMKKDIK